MKKAKLSKRFFAYIVDIIIVLILTEIIFSLLPLSNNVKTMKKNIENISSKLNKTDISDEELNNIIIDSEYEMEKDSVIIEIITIGIYILYFVVYPLYNNGQTLGKKLFRIKIISLDNDLNINILTIRTFIMYNILFRILLLLMIISLPKNIYLNFSQGLNFIYAITLMFSIAMIIFGKDGKGLHDLIARTQVVDC